MTGRDDVRAALRRTRVAVVADVPDGEAHRVEAFGVPIALVNIAGDFYAIGDTCSHGEYSLSAGEVWPDECEIECPKHGSMFSLRTGDALTLPATRPVPVFTVERDGDDLYVIAAEDPT